jgi:oligoendopeptidase F
MMTTQAVPPREAIAEADTWDANSIFPSDEAWECEAAQIMARLPELAAYKGHIGDSPAALADWLAAAEDISVRAYRLFVYATLFFEVNTADQDASAKRGKALGIFAQVNATTSFTDPELLEIGFDRLREWIRQEPRLATYAHYFTSLERLQAHVRSAEVEELLGLVQEPFSTAVATHGVLADADMRFSPARTAAGEERPLDQGNIDALLIDNDAEVRRTAFESYADAHLALRNTMANALAAGIKQDVFNARARRFSSSLEAALTPNHIPVAVLGDQAARPWPGQVGACRHHGAAHRELPARALRPRL